MLVLFSVYRGLGFPQVLGFRVQVPLSFLLGGFRSQGSFRKGLGFYKGSIGFRIYSAWLWDLLYFSLSGLRGSYLLIFYKSFNSPTQLRFLGFRDAFGVALNPKPRFRKQGTLIWYPKQQDPYYKDPRIRYPYFRKLPYSTYLGLKVPIQGPL